MALKAGAFGTSITLRWCRCYMWHCGPHNRRGEWISFPPLCCFEAIEQGTPARTWLDYARKHHILYRAWYSMKYGPSPSHLFTNRMASLAAEQGATFLTGSAVSVQYTEDGNWARSVICEASGRAGDIGLLVGLTGTDFLLPSAAKPVRLSIRHPRLRIPKAHRIILYTTTSSDRLSLRYAHTDLSKASCKHLCFSIESNQYLGGANMNTSHIN